MELVSHNISVSDVQTANHAFRDVLSMGFVRSKPFYEIVKRYIDFLGAFSLLILLAPVFLLVALAIRKTSPGPIFFRQKRLGQYGETFDCLKFRTMVVDADKILENDENLRRQFENDFKIKNDPRVTSIGDVLRRTSLDELPQLFNVLRGDISLIGPRPIVPPELDKYGIYANALLMVKPGLSGMWQVSGRSDTTYRERVEMDMNYIDHRSVMLDLALMARTVGVVLKRNGAY